MSNLEEDPAGQPEQQQDMEAIEMEMQEAGEVVDAAQQPNPSQQSGQNIPRKPLTPYLLFLTKQKNQHQQIGIKFSLKVVSDAWKELTTAEKQIYQEQYARQKSLYESYVKECAEKGINVEQAEELGFVFPTSRIRAIMKQDPSLNLKGDAVLTMNKAVQAFGQHVLAVVGRNLPARKKVDVSDLWQAIKTDRTLWFLRPLIDEWNKEHDEAPKQPTQQSGKKPKHISLQLQKPEMQNSKPQVQNIVSQPAKHQLKLTDMFPVRK